jgi:multidrug efflux pump subunit AcrB
MGPDPDKLRDIAAQALAVMHASPLMRTTNTDWGERVPSLRFALDQDRLQSIGLTSSDIAQQLQFLLSGIPITDLREDIRSVQVTARSAGNARLDPSRIADFTLVGTAGQRIPLSQIGTVEIRMEDPILRRRDRTPTITVRGDIAEGLQPPDVSTAVWKQLQPLIARLPAGYRIEEGGSIEESGKANRALAPLFPIMIALTLITIIFQVRSISMMVMVFATAPSGLVRVIPLTESVFWGTLPYTLIGEPLGGRFSRWCSCRRCMPSGSRHFDGKGTGKTFLRFQWSLSQARSHLINP